MCFEMDLKANVREIPSNTFPFQYMMKENQFFDSTVVLLPDSMMILLSDSMMIF